MKIRRKAACFALALLVALSVTGCVPAAQVAQTPPPSAPPASTPAAQPDTPAPTPPPTPAAEPFDFESLLHLTHQFGEAESIMEYGEDFTCTILYPACDVKNADAALCAWAMQLHDDAMEQMEEARQEDPSITGDLNVSYDSYIIKDQYGEPRFGSVIEHGDMHHSGLAHPIEIVHTINIDFTSGLVLSGEQLFPAEGRGHILALLAEKLLQVDPDLAEHAETIDERWMDVFLLQQEGVDFILPQSEFLPTALGTVALQLSYDELGDSIFWPPQTGNLKAPTPRPEPTIVIPVETGIPDQLQQHPTDAPPTGAPATDAPATGTPATTAPTAMPWEDAPGDSDPSGDGSSEYRVDPSKPMVALTFDDGPAKTTPKVLALLDKYGGRATFCMVGNRVKANADIVRQVAQQGSEIAGHTWDHTKLTRLSESEIKKQLSDTNNAVKAITGVTPVFLRPPYGSVNDAVRSATKELGMPIVNWSIDTEDWKTRDADATYDAIMKDVKDGAIILCHDLHAETGEAMERVIPELIRRGYQLVTVSELLNYPSGAKPGTVYRHRG